MNPTNTPTSKCCENLKPGMSQCNDCYDGDHCNGKVELCGKILGHTPTTDSKNSSEKQYPGIPRNQENECCGECWADNNSAWNCYHHCHTQNTTDAGWEENPLKVWGYIHSLPISEVQYADLCNGVSALVKHEAKEEYERGRKDSVKELHEYAKNYRIPFGILNVIRSGGASVIEEALISTVFYDAERHLEAALETPHE